MREVELRLFATLRKGRFETTRFRFGGLITVEELFHQYDIDPEEVSIIFVNGRHASPEQELQHGDVVSFFPAIGGG